jgi:ubiquinone/menaquinone biosynthesis C-methylase UbiE
MSNTVDNPFFARLWTFLSAHETEAIQRLRRENLAGLSGRVLEVGAGTGRNMAAYPAALDELVLTEPDPSMRRRLRRRVDESGRRATVMAAGAEGLPFPDAHFDTVVSTLVLCTVEDPGASVRELRRVLRPGGRLLFIEHVRADKARLARRQDRLAGAWRAFAAGCRCNRPTLELVGAHFAAHEATSARWRGMPRIVQPLIVGRAVA